jgi:hypothetical protein
MSKFMMCSEDMLQQHCESPLKTNHKHCDEMEEREIRNVDLATPDGRLT